MAPAELEALKALLAKANVNGLPLQEMATAGRELVFALLNAAPALIAAAEREVKLLEIVANNLPYLENLITLIGHDSAVLRKHSPPCGGHDFCLMKQAQKGAIAIRQALAENAG